MARIAPNPVTRILFRALSIWYLLVNPYANGRYAISFLAQACCGPFAHILPPYRLSSRHYLRISLSFCQVDGQFSTYLTDHHGHCQKREVCHFFLWSQCGDESQSVNVDNLPPFKPPISLLLSGRSFATSGVRLRRHSAWLRRGLVETMICRKASPLSFES